MDKKILGVVAGVIVIIAITSISLSLPGEEILVPTQKTNEKIGLVINSPKQSTTLQD